LVPAVRTRPLAWRTPQFLPSETVRRLLQRDPARGVLSLVLQWMAIFAIAALSELFWHPALYLLAALLIGGRQVALMLVVHEGVHNTLLKNRRWNDRIAEWFAAWPILMPYRSYRRIHREHHLYLGTPKDPDFARNRPDRLTEASGLAGVVRLLLGFEGRQVAVRRFWGPGDPEAEREGFAWRPALRVAAYLAVVAGAYAFGGLRLLALYWLVPLLWFLVAMRLKGIAEHFAVPAHSHLNQSRTFKPSFLASLLVTPLHAEYHIEHHLYPGVPHYRLPDLHKELARLPEYADEAHISTAYSDFLRECVALYRGARVAPAAPQTSADL
jgi:fatty acid desaturase